MSVPTWLVELYLNGSWVDVSAHVDTGESGQPITITRGRDNEQGTISAGVCSFSLVNDDGRYTIGLTTGAHYPHFNTWIPVRVTISGRLEYTGYMSQAETTLDEETGAQSHTVITCMDSLGTMAMAPITVSWLNGIVADLNPRYWWKLNDAVGATQAAASAGGQPLVASRALGSGTLADLYEFGTAALVGASEADTQLTLKGSTTDGAQFEISGTLAGLPTRTTGITVLCVATAPASGSPGGSLWKLTLGKTVIRATSYGTDGLTVKQKYGSATVGVDIAGVMPPEIPVLVGVTITETTITVLGTGQSFARNAPWSMNLGKLTVGYTAELKSGENTLSHVAILDGQMSEDAFAAMAAKVSPLAVAPVSTWLTRALDAAGVTVGVATTYDRPMLRPVLTDTNPAQMGASLASAAGAAFFTDRAGIPIWIDATYCPAGVAIDAAHVSTDLVWAPDLSLYYTDIQIDDVSAATRPGFPRQSISVLGLLPTDARAEYVDWLRVSADAYGGPRLSSMTVDLLTIPDAGPYQALDLRDRCYLANLPAQIPAGAMLVEGYTLTVGTTVWTKSLNTAPDPRFVIDEPAGTLDSVYYLYE